MRRAWIAAGALGVSFGVAAFAVWGCARTGGGGAGTSAFPFFQRPAAATTPAPRIAPIPIQRPVRAVWVARFHYRTPDDVRTIIRNCADLGVNTVLWQVRGPGTVMYPSRIEPWGAEFGYRDPGFDPLALAIEEAHQRGLRIEAWVNVMTGWHGDKPPPIREHIYHTQPGWFLHDAQGRCQPLSKQAYVMLNPCVPEVRQYIVGVMEEIVARYPVDGIHLDYVRYIWDANPAAKDKYPRDPRTLDLFHRETGRRPDDDVKVWRNWRINQLTRLVVEIDRMVARRRPGASLTAAVWRNPETSFNDHLQNSVAWLRSGVLDAVMPMAYTNNLAKLETDIGAYRELAPRGLVVPGLGIYLHETPGEIAAQLESCRRRGGDFALFSYESLFPTGNGGPGGVAAKADQARQMRREAVMGGVRH